MIAKTPGIKRLPDGRFKADVVVRLVDGRVVRRRKTLSTLTAAKEWRACIQHEARKGELIPERVTIAAMAQIAFARIRGKSNESNVHRYWKRIERFFGAHIQMATLTEPRMDRFKASLLSERLSSKSVDEHLKELGWAIRVAFESGWIKHRPRTKLVGGHGRRDLPITLEQFLQVTKALPKLRAFLLMALTTGQRMGDLRTMRWGQIKDNRIWFCSTKTKKEGLSVPLPSYLREELAGLPRRIATDRIFTQQNGKPMGCVQGSINRACRRLAVPRFTMHHVRHLAVSQLLIVTNGNTFLVGKITGMSQQVMARHYAHVIDQQDEAMKDFEISILNAMAAGGKK